MINKNIEERLKELLKDIEKLDVPKDQAVVQILMLQFSRDYGHTTLSHLIKDMPHSEVTANGLMELAVRYSDLRLIDMAVWYENYLSSTLREQTGSFYTPNHISSYMIKRCIAVYLHKETGIDENTIHTICQGKFCLDPVSLTKILTALKNIKLIDIACGTGLFILQSFEILFYLIKNLYIQLEKRVSEVFIKKYIVENILFAVDVQVFPVIMLRMTLFSLVYDKDEYDKESKLQLNILSRDSLTKEWLYNDQNFRNVIEERNGFDIVAGNPPYIGEKGNKVIFDEIKTTEFGAMYYEGKMDYFYFFIYKGMELLKKQGILCFITTNYFVTADGAVKLRKYLRDNCSFREIINFNHFEIFKSARGQHNIIFLITKEQGIATPVDIRCFLGKSLPEGNVEMLLNNPYVETTVINSYTLENQERLYNEKGHININSDQENLCLLDKIFNRKDYALRELCFVNQGIVSGADRITKEMLIKKISTEAAETYKYVIGEGIFVLSKGEAEKLGFDIYSGLKPMYKNSDIKRYRVKETTEKYILYISNKNLPEEVLNIIISKHLHKYKDVLDQRREILKGMRPWYALQWPRNQEIFEGGKIIVPHRGRENRFAYHDGPWYASADVYFITPVETSISLKLVLGQLNSKLMYFWLYNNGKRKGEQLELYSNPLKELPIQINMPKETKDNIVRLVDDMIQNGEEPDKQKVLDQMIYSLYGLTEGEKELIESLHRRELKKDSILV